MSTLTDRYVFAVVRSLPEAQRADIDSELRASIADDIEARIDAGASEANAEKDTLVELGDPDKLAAGYADRPSQLIGPALYFDYVRLLKVLYIIVLPIVAIAVAVAMTIAEDGIGEIIGKTVSITIGTAVHFGFWPTLVFAILERATPAQRKGWTGWTLDSLPQLPAKKQVGISDLVATVVMSLFFVGAAVWQHTFSVVSDEAGPIPLVNPELWAFWLPYFFGVAALEILFYVALYRIGRWTWLMAALNVPLGLLFAVPAVWLLANDLVFNPAFFDALDVTNDTLAVVMSITIPLIIIFTVWDFIDGSLKALRARRG